MDEILQNPRPRVNAELLPKFQGKHVTVLGNAESSKTMNERKVLTLMDGAGSPIEVYLGASLKGTERLEGLVEAVGSVDENNKVHAQLYREFKPGTSMGIYKHDFMHASF